MNRHVQAMEDRLSLCTPQRRSLELLHRIITITSPKPDAHLVATPEAIRTEFQSHSEAP